MVRQTSKWLVRLAGYGSAALLIACGVFLLKGQQRLLDLVSHTSQKPTEVFSLWLDLTPDPALTWAYVTETLHLLGYESVAGELAKPGQYRVEDTHIRIWTR